MLLPSLNSAQGKWHSPDNLPSYVTGLDNLVQEVYTTWTLKSSGMQCCITGEEFLSV